MFSQRHTIYFKYFILVGPALNDVASDDSIVFENVKFCYPSRPDVEVINNLSLVVPQGTSVAIVGMIFYGG